MTSVGNGEAEFNTINRFIAELTEMRKQIFDLKTSEAANRQRLETLQAGEKRMREVLESLPQRIFVKNKNLAYVFCNGSYARDLNLPADEIAGKIDYDFYPEDLASKYIADEERILSTGNMEEMDDRYLVSGQELTIRAVKTPLKDESGEITGILGIFWDITERKRAEEESENHRAHLAGLVEQHSARIQSLSDELQKALVERQGIEEEAQKVRTLLEGQLSERAVETQKLKEELLQEATGRQHLQDEMQQACTIYENQLKERAGELERTKGDLEREAAERKRIEGELAGTRETLEAKLSEREAELEKLTSELRSTADECRRLEEESGKVRASLAAQLEERSGELEKAKADLQREISGRKRIEEEIQLERASLQDQLSLRTAEVERLNSELLREIGERKEAVENLQQTLQQFRSIIDSVQQVQMRLGSEQLHSEEQEAAS